MLSFVLWVASGAIDGALVWNGFVGGSIGAVFPDTIPFFVWARTPLWAALAALLGALVVVVVHGLVERAVGKTPSSRARFVITWFVAIVAGALAGFAADAATIIDASLPAGCRCCSRGSEPRPAPVLIGPWCRDGSLRWSGRCWPDVAPLARDNH